MRLIAAARPAYHFLKAYRGNAAFRRANRFTRDSTLPISDRTILYEAGHGALMSCNPYALFLQLLRDPHYGAFEHVWTLNDPDRCPQEFRGLPNVRFVRFNSRAYIRSLATAKYLINNTTFPPYFVRRPEQVYVNTWHGTPLKHMGRDCPGVLGQHKNVLRNFLHVTHFVSPNRYTTNRLLESFDVKGIFAGTVLEVGHPRVDLTLNGNRADSRRVLGAERDQRILLYAPTWRGADSKVDLSARRFVEDAIALRDALEPEFKVLLRLHHWAKELATSHPRVSSMLADESLDTNVVLAAADVLVTDYSSVFFDFLATRRPIVFYTYDLGDYERTRGLYRCIEDLPGPACSTLDELIQTIRDTASKPVRDPRYAQAVEEFCSQDDGGASRRVVDIVFRGAADPRARVERDPGRRSILLYLGRLSNNGITTSALDLLSSLDSSRYSVYTLHPDRYDRVTERNMRRLPRSVRMLYRTGPMNTRFREKLAEHRLFQARLGARTCVPWELYRREARRLFGDACFDIIVDFSGYSKFWTLLLAAVDQGRKSIYQHNEMFPEYLKVVGGKRVHEEALAVVFNLYRYYDRVVSVGRHTREANECALGQYVPEAREAFVVVHNAIDPQRLRRLGVEAAFVEREGVRYWMAPYSTPEGEQRSKPVRMPEPDGVSFVTLGRLSPEKGQFRLISAFTRLVQEHPRARLYILGEGPERPALESQIAHSGVGEAILLVGHVDNPFPLVRECSCFVLASDHEGQPMALLEAMGLGLPIVATDSPGSRSAVEQGYGHLVGRTEDALYQGLRDFMDGNVGAGHFDLEAYNCAALRMFYREVCGEQPLAEAEEDLRGRRAEAQQ